MDSPLHPEHDRLGAPRAARRRPIFWSLVALSVLTIACGPAATEAIDFRLPATDGQQVQLSSLRGTVVLLNFWATWCPPCKAEMPDLNALHQGYAAQHRFTVVGVDVEETQAEVAVFARQYNLSFPLLVDNKGSVSNDRYNIRSLPTSMIIDREGKVRDMWVGQIPRSAMLARLEKVW